MLSISNDSPPTIGDRILAAAADCVLALGVDRVTLAEIARRAQVSRPTVYRRWSDTRSVLAALLTSRVIGVLDDVPSQRVGREALVERIVTVAERLGTSQQVLLDAVAADIKLAQEDGSVRAGDPRQLAAMCLLISQSTIQSGQIVAPILDVDALAVELAHSLNGYLKR